MRAVIQRVEIASVDVMRSTVQERIAEIGPGFLILVGVRKDDEDQDALYLAQKASTLRVFEDPEGKLNLSLIDTGASALVVSNFTLYADCRKGRRPSFTDAASGEHAERLYKLFGDEMARAGIPVQYGEFGAEMKVSLVNDGPITVMLDSRKEF